MDVAFTKDDNILQKKPPEDTTVIFDIDVDFDSNRLPMKPKYRHLWLAQCGFRVTGYDNDFRELGEIPEAIDRVNRFYACDPLFPTFLNLDPVHSMLCGLTGYLALLSAVAPDPKLERERIITDQGFPKAKYIIHLDKSKAMLTLCETHLRLMFELGPQYVQYGTHWFAAAKERLEEDLGNNIIENLKTGQG